MSEEVRAEIVDKHLTADDVRTVWLSGIETGVMRFGDGDYKKGVIMKTLVQAQFLCDAINNYARVKEELLIKETQSAKLLNDYFTLEKPLPPKTQR